MIKFQVGQHYSCRSICDHECVFRFQIVARTDATVSVFYQGKIARRKVREWDGAETIDPMGRYSMSPVLTARDLSKPDEPSERLVVTELHYHRNGVFGSGYYAGRAEWHVNGGDVFKVMFVAFLQYPDSAIAEGNIAVMGDGEPGTSYRYEDFSAALRKFIESRGGQALAFPHTIVQHA